MRRDNNKDIQQFKDTMKKMDVIRDENILRNIPRTERSCMKRIKPSEGNKTFCMAPWTHTYLSPQTERRMCCASREPAQSFKQYIDTGNDAKEYKPLHFKEHWNSDHMKSVRLRMMAGEELSECEVCDHKLLNTDVYRSYWNQLFKRQGR